MRFLLLVVIAVFSADALRGPRRTMRHSAAIRSEARDDSAPLWKERVSYVDLSASEMEASPTARSLPLFLLGGAFYPQGQTLLHVFEMKYRTMMFDCSQADDMFGHIFVDQRTGQIASIGTLCKITDRELLEDGRQVITIDGVERFKVRKILKTLPYMLAEVEPAIADSMPDDLGAAMKLERSVWDVLKYYMRLMRSYEPNKAMVVSRATKRNRPNSRVPETPDEALQRMCRFSFSLANMIQMTQPKEAQLLLQTTDVVKRLEAEKTILQTAADLIAEQLVKMGIITADVRDSIK